jgi:hypothetical protein
MFHLIEGREALEKLQRAMDILLHRGLASLAEGLFVFGHDSGRLDALSSGRQVAFL